MLRHLPLILLALVVAEIWLLVVIGGHIGGLATFGLVVAGAIGGGWIARREAGRAMAAWQQATMTGEVPGPQLATSAMIVIAGVLLALPGVISDVAGLALLLPPVRRALGGRVAVAFGARLRAPAGFASAAAPAEHHVAQIIDLDPTNVRDKPE